MSLTCQILNVYIIILFLNYPTWGMHRIKGVTMRGIFCNPTQEKFIDSYWWKKLWNFRKNSVLNVRNAKNVKKMEYFLRIFPHLFFQNSNNGEIIFY